MSYYQNVSKIESEGQNFVTLNDEDVVYTYQWITVVLIRNVVVDGGR